MRLSPAVFVAAVALISQGCSSIPSISNSDLLSSEGEAVAAKGSGYVSSEGSHMVHSSYKDCIRTESWTAELNLVECNASAKPQVVEKALVADSSGRLASFSGQAMFGFDSSELTSDGMDALLELTDKLNNQAEITEIEVVGHTDSSGSDAYNQMLSERRAATVGNYLKSYLKTVNVKSSGMGESAPVADNNTNEGRILNRRVEVKIGAMMPVL